jgi:hypothetical protein
MSTTEKSTTFHGSNAVLRIAMAANIVSWFVLAVYLVSFTGDIVSNSATFGAISSYEPMQQVMFWTGLASRPVFGIFYFILLQAVSQLLYLGMDLYLELTDGAEDETEEKNSEAA